MRDMRAFIGCKLILIQSSELARNNKRFSGNNDICASVLCSEKRTSQSANYNLVDKHWGEGWSAPLCTRKCSSCITIANTTYLLSATGIPKTDYIGKIHWKPLLYAAPLPRAKCLSSWGAYKRDQDDSQCPHTLAYPRVPNMLSQLVLSLLVLVPRSLCTPELVTIVADSTSGIKECLSTAIGNILVRN